MLNKSTSSSKYVVQSGVTPYPIGFEFQYNGDDTPQIRVTIGAMVAEENVHFVISEDLLNIELIPLEEETPVDPNDYSWMDKWVGMELVIERDIPFVQESDYQLGRISPERIEKDFDLSVMRDQMLAGQIKEHTDDVQDEIDALNSRIDFVQEEHVLDMAAVDEALGAKATKTELENAKTTLSAGIQGNAQAIQKTREDYMQADSEIHQILNSHADELTTLHNDVDALGDQVAGIEEKIPESASATNQLATKEDLKDVHVDLTGYATTEYVNAREQEIRDDVNQADSELQTQLTAQASAITANTTSINGVKAVIPDGTSDTNPLVNKQQLLDEEMDIRDDLNGGLSELQTQITAQAAAIAGKQDELIAGENISIVDNVISATGGGGGGDYLPLTGGTLTGSLTFEWSGQYMNTDQVAIKSKYHRASNNTTYEFDVLTISPDGGVRFGKTISAVSFTPQLAGASNVGSTILYWNKVFTSSINAGRRNMVDSGDLIVPTTGGTLARIEDIEAIGGDGTTGQVLTKTDTGMAWQDASGGGSGIANVVHDTTLTGSGTTESPLGLAETIKDEIASKAPTATVDALTTIVNDILTTYLKKTGDTMTGALTVPEFTVSTAEGTFSVSITAGVATIATNNGLDIAAQTKFDTAPTTDDTTAWADVNPTALVTKQQVTTALSSAGGGSSITIRNWA